MGSDNSGAVSKLVVDPKSSAPNIFLSVGSVTILLESIGSSSSLESDRLGGPNPVLLEVVVFCFGYSLLRRRCKDSAACLLLRLTLDLFDLISRSS